MGDPGKAARAEQQRKLAEREAQMEAEQAERAETQKEETLARRRKQRGRISLISDLENLGSRTTLGGK